MNTTAPSAAPAETVRHRWLALTVLLVSAALTIVSVASVNVGLPAIRDGLGASPVECTVVLTAYSLAYAVVLLPAGRIGDRRIRRGALHRAQDQRVVHAH